MDGHEHKQSSLWRWYSSVSGICVEWQAWDETTHEYLKIEHGDAVDLLICFFSYDLGISNILRQALSDFVLET